MILRQLFSIDSWLEVWQVVRRSPMRTALTMGGVFWGMFMLLAMAGFGRGLEHGVARSLGGRASNAVFVWGRFTSMPYKGTQSGHRIQFDNADVLAIQSQIADIEHLAPRLQLGGWRARNEVTGSKRSGAFQVMGDTPALMHVQPMRMLDGRFVNPIDIESHRKVAVIGAQVAAELYGEEPAVGQSISINGVWFLVVGVFQSMQSGDAGERADSTVHVPFSTFQHVFIGGGDRVNWIAFTGVPSASAVALEAQVRALLSERHKISPQDEPALGSFNAAKEWRQLQATFAGIRLFVLVVGTFTLLSGVVGVSNILLVTVRERTMEIGLRRALGATQGRVIAMIVQEALVLVGVAGYVGIIAGVALLELTRRLVGESNETLGNPQVEPELIAAAGVCLLFAGVMAAWVPAARAAQISPVEALRSE